MDAAKSPQSSSQVGRFLHLQLVLGGLLTADYALKQLFLHMHWSFPAPLAGMFAIIGGLALTESLQGAKGLAAVNAAFAPALAWLGRWLPLFFVPVMVTISLATKGLAGADFAKFAFIVCAGMVASLLFTAATATTIRGVMKTEMLETPKEEAAPPFVRSHFVSWAVIGAAALPLSFLFPAWAHVAGIAFSLAATVLGYLVGSSFPKAVKKVFHPIITTGAVGSAGCAFWSATHGMTFEEGLRAYLSKGAGPMGAGDILMGFLGIVILSFGFRIYSQRALMRRHFVEIFGTVVISSLFSLFATAFAASLIGLGPILSRSLLSRSVTVALALPMASILGASQPLTAAAVCVTGLIGANFAQTLLNLFGFRDPITRGLATAGSAHGLGTAALAANEPEALPFCALAYALMGITSNVLVTIPAVRGALLAITG